MYKSIKKTFFNPYGMEEVSNVQDLTKPVIIAVFPPYNTNKKEINGYLKCIKENLKMYMTEYNSNLGYFIDDVPFNLIYFSHNDDIFLNGNDGYDSKIKEFLNLIPENNVVRAKQMFKNINIYCFCAGNDRAFLLMKKFRDKLISLNYKEEDIKLILDEVGILQFVDNLSKDYQEDGIFTYGTCFNISDFYDSDNLYNERSLSNEISNQILKYKMESNKNFIGFQIKSFGEGSLCEERFSRYHEFKKDFIKQPIINMIGSIILITFINISLNNNISKSESIKMVNRLVIAINKNFEDYLSKNKKELSNYSEEDLNNLYKYLNEKLLNLICAVYDIKPNEQSRIDDNVKELEQIKKFWNLPSPIYHTINLINEVMKEGDTHLFLDARKWNLEFILDTLRSLFLKIETLEISEESKKKLKNDIEFVIKTVENNLYQYQYNSQNNQGKAARKV